MEKMPDGTSVTWQLLCDEHAFSREHYTRLDQLSTETLRESISELAARHCGQRTVEEQVVDIP